MTENLIFDLGQVLIHWSPERFTKAFGLPTEDEELLRRETFDGGEWDRLDEGTMTEEEAAAAVCARLPERLHSCVDQLVNGWWELELEPVEGMPELLEELKANGYRLFLLSNAGLSLRPVFPRIPGSGCFDGLYLSAEHQLLKPALEIYLDFLRNFSLEADSCYFVDDKEANIRGAAEAGIRGTVFTGSVGELRRTLQAAGIRCKD